MKKFISILIAITIIFSMVFVPSGSASANSGVTDFVTRLYNVCLDRQPDSAGLNAWSSQLINKKSTGISAAYGFVSVTSSRTRIALTKTMFATCTTHSSAANQTRQDSTPG